LVKLYLPKSSDRPIIPEIGTETASLRPASGHETILVVEDDEDVLIVAAENLRALGYQVVTAVNAAQALDILRGGHPQNGFAPNREPRRDSAVRQKAA